jgi:hypothetical protein
MIPPNRWAWPADWDEHSYYSVFTCPRLWFRLRIALAADAHVVTVVDDNTVTCSDATHRAVWVLTGDEDAENKAVLGVWPD